MLLLSLLITASASPLWSVRTGQDCAACHVSAAGSGLRTDRGADFAARLSSWEVEAAVRPVVGPATLGGQLAMEQSVWLPASSSLGDTERSVEGEAAYALQAGDLYLGLRDGPVQALIDTDVSPSGPAAREVWLGVGGQGWALQAGRLRLIQGLRGPDRVLGQQALELEDSAGELGLAGQLGLGPASLGASITRPAQAISAAAWRLDLSASAAGQGWLAGASSAWLDNRDPYWRNRSWAGTAWGGVGRGPIALLGEAALRDVREPSGRYGQLGLSGELNLLPIDSLVLRLGWQGFDPLRAVDENQRDAFVLGARWFPLPLIALATSYTMARDIPQRIRQNRDLWQISVALRP